MSFGRDVRGALFRGVTAFSAADVNTFGASSLITRITNDVQQVQMLVVMICTLFVAAPIMIVGGLFFAIREDGPLSLILVVAIPALACSVGLVVIRLIPQFENMQNRIDRTNQVLREQITGIRVIRAFVREPEEGQRFGIANADLTQSSLAAGRLQAFMFPSVMLVLNLSSVAAVWFGADRVASGDMQIGTLIAFLTYLIQILTATMMATFVAVMWPRAAVCAARVKEVLDTAPSMAAPTTPVLEMPLRATFEMRNVHFSYPGAEEPVLNDISFRVNPGESLAVVGSTGAGKTTLLGLGPRLYDSTGGSVLVNGVDVRAVAPETLWSHIGLVPQKPYLFSGTVASNLRFGREEATDDELWEALEVAQARDFVASMPGGLDSPIAQGGTNVSGGQRQRLAIARALVQEARHLPLRRLLLRPRPRDRRPPARRARAGGRRRRGRHRGAADLHHHRLGPDPRDRRRTRGRARPPRGADRDLPDLRRDRRIPDRARPRHERDTMSDDGVQPNGAGGAGRAGEGDQASAARSRSPFGRGPMIGVPAEKSENFRASAMRLRSPSPRRGPQDRRRPHARGRQRRACWCSGRGCSVPRPTRSSPASRATASTSRSCTAHCCSRSACTSRPRCSVTCRRTCSQESCNARCRGCAPKSRRS